VRINAHPLPKTKIVPNQVIDGFAPSPLDELSLQNGVDNFVHDQGVVESSALPFIAAVFDHYWPDLQNRSRMLGDDQVDIAVRCSDHATKASGYPFSAAGASTKVAALDAFGIEFLREYYRSNSCILGCTLKDEIRVSGKDARLFRPSDLSAYIEGLTLFYDQDEYLMSNLLKTPMFVRFETPGPDLINMFNILRNFSGENFAADGKKWDAHFPLVVAMFIAWWRGGSKRVRRYYEQMYNGWTQVFDALLNLIGNPSGHMNTTTDNCLCHVFVFALHAWRNGWSLQQFFDNVKFFLLW